MPTAMIQNYASQSGKTVKEVEKIWNATKEQAKKKFPKEDAHYWAYVNTTVRMKLGIEQKIKDKEAIEKAEKRKAKSDKPKKKK